MERSKYEYIGDISQLFRVETYRLEGGRKEGIRATGVSNEKGLNFTVVADRCMDISHLSYKGVNLSYITPSGVVAPQYYDRTGLNWLKSFSGGFVTTCGLENIGNPCVEGEEFGLHGRIGNTPAEEYCVEMIKEENGNKIKISGKMRQSYLFGDKLHLKRTIYAFQEKNIICIEDEIINTGFKNQEYMQLYHCNIGYPFLSPECEILIPSYMVNGANEYSQNNIDKWNLISEPSEVGEMCYIHKIKEDKPKRVGMFSHKWGFGFVLQFEGTDLDKLLQWRCLSKGEYVIGIEPATNFVEGRKIERDKTGLKCIAPGQSIKHKLEIAIYDSYQEIKDKVFH